VDGTDVEGADVGDTVDVGDGMTRVPATDVGVGNTEESETLFRPLSTNFGAAVKVSVQRLDLML
jgi:hypothetical protein